MTNDRPLLFPLDIIRATGLRPLLIDDLGDPALLARENGIIFIDAGLTLRQLGEVAAQCLTEAAARVETLLVG